MKETNLKEFNRGISVTYGSVDTFDIEIHPNGNSPKVIYGSA